MASKKIFLDTVVWGPSTPIKWLISLPGPLSQPSSPAVLPMIHITFSINFLFCHSY